MYNEIMGKRAHWPVEKGSHSELAKKDIERIRAMTRQQRIDEMLQLCYNPDAPRLERVYRVLKPKSS